MSDFCYCYWIYLLWVSIRKPIGFCSRSLIFHSRGGDKLFDQDYEWGSVGLRQNPNLSLTCELDFSGYLNPRVTYPLLNAMCKRAALMWYPAKAILMVLYNLIELQVRRTALCWERNIASVCKPLQTLFGSSTIITWSLF